MKKFKEYLGEAFFKVSIPDVAPTFVEADSASKVKMNMRKILKPDVVKELEIERVTPAKMKQMYRDMAKGKEAEPEAEGLTDPSQELCSVNCTKDLLKHINSKKRKLDLYRKILEIKYNRYKICYSSWSLTTIFLSTILTLIESCKLIFLDDDVHDKILMDFFDF